MNIKYFNGADLQDFINNEDLLFFINRKEANVLLEYLEVDGILIFAEGWQLKMKLPNYSNAINVSTDIIIDRALDIHYNIINKNEEKMRRASGHLYKVLKRQHIALLKDKAVLDNLFSRTIYGKMEKRCFA